MVQWMGTCLKAVKLRRAQGAQVANPGLHPGTSCVAGGSPEPHAQSTGSLVHELVLRSEQTQRLDAAGTILLAL